MQVVAIDLVTPPDMAPENWTKVPRGALYVLALGNPSACQVWLRSQGAMLPFRYIAAYLHRDHRRLTIDVWYELLNVARNRTRTRRALRRRAR